MAKRTFYKQDANMQCMINDQVKAMVTEVYRGCPKLVSDVLNNMIETQYYGLVAIALSSFGIWPADRKYMNGWEDVKNPIIALRNAEKELDFVKCDIKKKCNIEIAINENGVLFK